MRRVSRVALSLSLCVSLCVSVCGAPLTPLLSIRAVCPLKLLVLNAVSLDSNEFESTHVQYVSVLSSLCAEKSNRQRSSLILRVNVQGTRHNSSSTAQVKRYRIMCSAQNESHCMKCVSVAPLVLISFHFSNRPNPNARVSARAAVFSARVESSRVDQWAAARVPLALPRRPFHLFARAAFALAVNQSVSRRSRRIGRIGRIGRSDVR